MIAISKSSVEHWDDFLNEVKPDEWLEHKKMVTDRLGNMNVTVSVEYEHYVPRVSETYVQAGLVKL